MSREEERIQAALSYGNNQEDIPIVDDFSRNLCIALAQAYMKGSVWADTTMLPKICSWLKNNTNLLPTEIENMLKSVIEG